MNLHDRGVALSERLAAVADAVQPAATTLRGRRIERPARPATRRNRRPKWRT